MTTMIIVVGPMMESNDNPPKHVRVALRSTVVVVVAASGVGDEMMPPRLLPLNSYVASVCMCS
jgi:hypothetical protein